MLHTEMTVPQIVVNAWVILDIMMLGFFLILQTWINFHELYDNWEDYNLNDPHKDCVHHINVMGLSPKLKFMLYEKTDHFTVRSRIKNCEYKNEFDVSKLEFFNSHNFERHKMGLI